MGNQPINQQKVDALTAILTLMSLEEINKVRDWITGEMKKRKLGMKKLFGPSCTTMSQIKDDEGSNSE